MKNVRYVAQHNTSFVILNIGLSGQGNIISGLLLGRSEVLRSLRHYLRAQSQGHHPIDRLEERVVERGSAR